MSQVTPFSGTPEIIKLGKNVYAAAFFSGGIPSMIEGSNGIVIIDTGDSPKGAEDILAEFRKITDKPVLAIIYTHGHPDHTNGSSGFVRSDNRDVQVWARDNLYAENRLLDDFKQATAIRGAKQFGITMEQMAEMFRGNTAKPLEVTHPFSNEPKQVIRIDDIELEIYPASGETADHVFIFYPQESVLFSGDLMYRSFPNMYAARGAGYRDVKTWIHAVEQMKNLQPKFMVVGHGAPTTSPEETKEFIANYYEALSYVYNKTVEGINKGLSIDEIGHYVCELPDHLKLPYLVEAYGNISWTAKAIFTGYFGWFDGNARKLAPLTGVEEAQSMADLVGGADNLLSAAQKALYEKKYKWAAQLAEYCIKLDSPAELIMAEALESLIEEQTSSIAKNFLKSDARILREKAKK